MNSTAVEAVANAVQAEQLARTGVSLAVTAMADNAAKSALGQQTVSFTNGTVTYQAWIFSGTQSKITSTGTFNGKTVTMTAVVTFERNRWRVLRSSIIPSPDAVS
ncbi:MAG: competence type IV pilus minor pilin ComGG [Bacteroidota bacterium]